MQCDDFNGLHVVLFALLRSEVQSKQFVVSALLSPMDALTRLAFCLLKVQNLYYACDVFMDLYLPVVVLVLVATPVFFCCDDSALREEHALVHCI